MTLWHQGGSRVLVSARVTPLIKAADVAELAEELQREARKEPL